MSTYFVGHGTSSWHSSPTADCVAAYLGQSNHFHADTVAVLVFVHFDCYISVDEDSLHSFGVIPAVDHLTVAGISLQHVDAWFVAFPASVPLLQCHASELDVLFCCSLCSL